MNGIQDCQKSESVLSANRPTGIEKRKFIIYKVTNIKTKKIYIGQTARTVHIRRREHRQYAKSGCPYCLHRAIRKDGIKNFIFEILFYCLSQEDMDQKEIELIKTMNCRAPNGYNLSDGGKCVSGHKVSKEARAKISKALSVRVITKETREKLRLSNTGYKMTIEAKAKISAFNTGRKATDATKAKMSASHMGHEVTEETKIKISRAKTGCKMSAMAVAGRIGYKATDAARANLRAAWVKRKLKKYGKRE